MSLLNKASLIQIPSGYKDGTLYSAKPTNGDGDFTFSRGSNLAATRVNSDGLIEKGRENLLLQSNSFNTGWTLTSGSSVTGGQTGYDGSSDAWLLTDSGNSSAYALYRGYTDTGVQTFSIYAKQNTTSQIEFDFLGGGGGYLRVELTNGSLHATNNTIDYNIQDVGSGWYRCSFAVNHTSAPALVRIGCNGAGSIFIQDAQVEQGLVATKVIETGASTAQAGILEDMPRLDYSGGATCPSLLLEPSRVNFITQSEYTGSYGKNETPVITDNAHISPEGVQNATNLNIDSVSEGFFVFPTSVTSGTSYTISVFIKYIDGSQTIRFGHAGAGFGGDNNNVFNVSTGVVVSESGGTCSVEDYGNGWYRLIATRTAAASSTGGLILYGNAETNSNFAVYGFQMEAGSYPTSYIPTYGASVTRSVDSCSKTGISSLIGQTEGTLFVDFNDTGFTPSNASPYIEIYNDVNNRITIFKNISTQYQIVIRVSGITEVNIISAGITGRVKLAFAYAVNNAVVYINGTQIGLDTSTTVPTCSSLYLGSSITGTYQEVTNGTNQALLFPTRLTNDELASLTTL